MTGFHHPKGYAMKVRAKFTCQSVMIDAWKQTHIVLTPVTRETEEPDSEDTKFWEATPSGEIKIDCANAVAAEMFEPGKKYYVDFSPADE